MNDATTHMGDAAGAGVLLLWMNNYLPAIATLLTCIWFALRIYETETVQRLVGRRRKSRDDDMPTDME